MSARGLPGPAEIRRALDLIPRLPHDEWVQVQLSLAKAYQGDDGIKDAVLAWTARHSTSEEREQDARIVETNFRSWRSVTSLTFGTFVQIARDHGWTPPAPGRGDTAQDAVTIRRPAPDTPAATEFQRLEDSSWQIVAFAMTPGRAAERAEVMAAVADDLDSFAPAPRIVMAAMREYISRFGCNWEQSAFIGYLAGAPGAGEAAARLMAEVNDPSRRELWSVAACRAELERMRPLAERLRVRQIADECAAAAWMEPEAFYARVTQMLNAARAPHRFEEVLTLKDLIKTSEEVQRDFYGDGFHQRLLTTGLTEVDEILGGGIVRGEVTIFAANTGVGKTFFGLQTAFGAALAGHRVIFFSAEMERRSLVERLENMLGGLNRYSRQNEATDLYEQGHQTFLNKISLLQDENLGLICRRGMNIDDIITTTRAQRYVKKVDLIIVDYLQLLDNPAKEKQRATQAEAVNDTMRQLAELCTREGVACLCLAQLADPNGKNRERAARETNIYDISMSKIALAHASHVLVCYPDPDGTEEEKKHCSRLKLVCGKNRYARAGLHCYLCRPPEAGEFTALPGDADAETIAAAQRRREPPEVRYGAGAGLPPPTPQAQIPDDGPYGEPWR